MPAATSLRRIPTGFVIVLLLMVSGKWYVADAAPPAGVSRLLEDYSVPTLEMRNQRSETVSLAELVATDKPVLLNFIFTSCTAICPTLSGTFANVQHLLGEDSGKVRMISISIDPEHDRPSVLAEYASRFGAGPQWYFLTGTLADSIAAQQAFDTDRGDKMNHGPLTFLRPGRQGPWRRYVGFARAAYLVAEIRESL